MRIALPKRTSGWSLRTQAILLHPAPKRALFLGVGTGLTSSSATIDPALHVDTASCQPARPEAGEVLRGLTIE